MLRRRLGASVIALLVAVLLSAAGSSAASAGACADSATVAADAVTRARASRAVLCMVNNVRADRGLRRLRVSRRLNTAARFHSRDMVSRKYFDHHGPAGDDLAMRLRRVRYFATHPQASASEALAWATDASAQILVRALLDSPTHRGMLLNPRARELGTGLTLGAPEAGVGGAASTLVLDFGE